MLKKRFLSALIIFSGLMLLTFLFSACTNGVVANNVPPNPNNSTPSNNIQLGPQPCPGNVSTKAYWGTIVPLNQANGDHVYSVTCGHLKGNASLQALIDVTCDCSGGFINAFVYDNLSATPVLRFQLQGLEKGEATISHYSTIITDQVDEASSENIHAPANASLVPDLYREFKWVEAAGTFIQVSFPGLFPDLTRYQAENDQQQVNQGHQPWKLSATMTAQAFAASLLKWNPNAATKIVSGGGSHDVSAVVEVRNTAPHNQDPLTVTMTRLEGNTNGGIWIVTAAQNRSEQLSTPQSGATLISPAHITGAGNGFDGAAGTIVIEDHLYTTIGHLVVPTSNGRSIQAIDAHVPFTSTFGEGTEEGLVLLYDGTNNDGSILHPVFAKVLIRGAHASAS